MENTMRVYLGGTFDIIHPGHIKLFRWAKENFGEVWVALNTDEFILRYKGKAPAMTFEQRRDVLKELRSVDAVVTNTGCENSIYSILVVQPDVIVVGSDWTRERIIKQLNISEAFLLEHHINLIIYANSDPIHSSDIKKRMA
jgi:cytidyltransferase-like protein